MKTKLGTPVGSAEITEGPMVAHAGKMGATEEGAARVALASDSLLSAYLLEGNPLCLVCSTSFIHLLIYSCAIIEHLLGAKHFAEYLDDVSTTTRSPAKHTHVLTPSPASPPPAFPLENPTLEYSGRNKKNTSERSSS